MEYINIDTLASGSLDNTIQIWCISTGATLRTINVNQWVLSLKLLVNGFYLAAGLQNGNICIYNINDGSLVSTLIGHTDQVYDLELIGSDLLASASRDRNVRVWNLIRINLF